MHWQHSPRGSASTAVFVAAVLLSLAAPSGAEFRLPPSTGDQGQPAVATDAKGNAVIVWQELFPGGAQPLNTIRMQRFDATGAPVGLNQRVDVLPGDNARNPAIDVAADGSFVIVWEGGASEGPYRRTVWARRFGPDGTPLGSELRVNTDRLFDQRFAIADTRFGTPDVSIAPDGGFVVVWRDDGANRCSRANIVVRRYAADGKPRDPVFRVNTPLRDSHLFPVVDHDATGGFVVVWQHSTLLGTPDERSEIRGQRFNAAGKPVDGGFGVRTDIDRAVAPSLVVAKDGSFVVAWLEWEYDAFDPKILARRISATGEKGPVIKVATEFLDHASHPKLVSGTERFTVVWSGGSFDPWVGTRIWSRRFSKDDGSPEAPRLIGPGTCRQRGWPDAAPLRNDSVIAVWAVSPSHEIEGVRVDRRGSEVPTPSLAPAIAERWPALLPTEELYPVVKERVKATRELGCLRFEASAAAPLLTSVAASKRDTIVAAVATWALAMVTPNTDTVLPLLLEGVDENDLAVQHEAARGLGVIGRTEGIPPLVEMLVEGELYPLRARAAASLGDIGSKPELPRETQNAIREALSGVIMEEEREGFYDNDDVVKITAARALVRLPSPGFDADRIIFNALAGEHPELALELLGKLDNGFGWQHDEVKKMLSDSRPAVRAAVIRCMAQHNYPGFATALEDSSPLVRAAAAEGLRSLGQTAMMTAGGEIELAARNEIDENAKLQIDAAWAALQDANCSNPVAKRTPTRTSTVTPTPRPPTPQLEYSVCIVSDRSFHLTPRSAAEVWSQRVTDPSSKEPPHVVVWSRPQVSPETAAIRLKELEAMSQAELTAIVESHFPTWRETVAQPFDPSATPAPWAAPRRAHPVGVAPSPSPNQQ